MKPNYNRFGRPMICTSFDRKMYPFLDESLMNSKYTYSDDVLIEKEQSKDFARYTENMRR